MLAQEYLEGQSCKTKSLENTKNRQIITFTLALVDAIHQSMLSSWSGYFNFVFNVYSSSEFPYCDGNLIGTKFAHIFHSCTNLQKSLILWFMLDLWPLKYLCANMRPYCFLHNRNKQYLDKLRVVKTPWVLVGASLSGHWMIAYWLFKLIKSCTLWFMLDLWPIHSSLCQHEPKLISSMQATVIR